MLDWKFLVRSSQTIITFRVVKISKHLQFLSQPVHPRLSVMFSKHFEKLIYFDKFTKSSQKIRIRICQQIARMRGQRVVIPRPYARIHTHHHAHLSIHNTPRTLMHTRLHPPLHSSSLTDLVEAFLKGFFMAYLPPGSPPCLTLLKGYDEVKTAFSTPYAYGVELPHEGSPFLIRKNSVS